MSGRDLWPGWLSGFSVEDMMIRIKRLVWAASIVLVGLGVVSLVLNVGLGLEMDFSWPLVVILLSGTFFILAEALREKWRWADWFIIPACLLLALGLIFLLNVITNDWGAWAYAWLLLVSALGAGAMLVNRNGRWPQQVNVAGLGTLIGGTTLCVLFGALVGGLFIKIMAPLLLVAFGISLRWLPLEKILPERLGQLVQKSARADREQKAGVAGQQAGMIEPLSAREMEVLGLIDEGLSNAEIAERLSVANSTVKTHINNIYNKMAVETRIQAIRQARELGLLKKV
jgi:DNA-binding CsgD family transcriptional regulator